MNTLKYLIASMAMIMASMVQAQVSYLDNDPNTNPVPMGFLGWDDTGNEILDIRQNNQDRIRFFSTTYNTLDGVTVNNASRMSFPLNGNSLPAAFSMMHMGSWATGSLRRDWMNVGTTYTDNQDILHVGLYRQPDTTYGATNNVTDAVIAWGDNDSISKFGPDNLRFIFIKPTSSTFSDPSATDEGMEVGRFTSEGNFGIGNFFTNGIYEQPTHRLDVLGTARLRDMDEAVGQVLITGVERDSVGDYVLHYNPYPDDSDLFLDGTGNWTSLTGGGGADCRWVDMNSNTVASEQDIRTGWDQNDPCYRGKVSIGIESIKSAKLMVNSECNRDFVPQGIHSRVLGRLDYNSPELVGVLSIARGRSNENNSNQAYFGVQAFGGQAFTAQNHSAGKDNVGVYAIAGGHTYSANSIAVYGKATKNNAGSEIGLYGENTTSGNPLYLVGGPAVLMGSSINVSDETIKHDINPIHEATATLNALQPKTYYLHSPENRPIAFDENLQYGLIAQEVREVLPEIVRETTVPEMTDSTGFVEGTSVDLLGVQYDALIPILIAGFNEQSSVVSEQQGIIQDQNEMIASLQETLEAQNEALSAMQAQMEEVQSQVALMQVKTNNCCTNSDGETMGAKSTTEGQELKLEQNVPNPFSEQTRIDFELPQEAQVVLEITDQMGRPIERLIDGRMSQGVHSTTWDGSRLARGVYFYTLYADGHLVTKKMIKN